MENNPIFPKSRKARIDSAILRLTDYLSKDPQLIAEGWRVEKSYWLGTSFHIIFVDNPNCIVKDYIQICFYGEGIIRYNGCMVILENY